MYSRQSLVIILLAIALTAIGPSLCSGSNGCPEERSERRGWQRWFNQYSQRRENCV